MQLPFDTELLIKYIQSESNADERILIENWLNQDKVNDQFYKQFKRFWMGLGIEYQKDTYDIDKAWLKTSSRLVSKRRIGIYRYVAVAAVVLGIITGGYSWWDYSQWVRFETGDGTQIYALSDGSQVQLNHHSIIAFRQKEGQRLVKMEGEVFFEVSRDEQKPFVIKTPNGIVQVLGTSFNIRARESAVTERLYVTSGEVAMAYKKNANQILLSQGQLGVLNKLEQSLEKKLGQTINDLAWRTRKINFENANVQEICEVLASVYNVNLNVDMAYKDRTVNVEFDNQPIEEVLDVICFLIKGKLTIEGDTYRIK